jgi:hypothetical protein
LVDADRVQQAGELVPAGSCSGLQVGNYIGKDVAMTAKEMIKQAKSICRMPVLGHVNLDRGRAEYVDAAPVEGKSNVVGGLTPHRNKDTRALLQIINVKDRFKRDLVEVQSVDLQNRMFQLCPGMMTYR